jgi:hypothetical protein
MRIPASWLALGLTALAADLRAQVVAGPEFRANTFTISVQENAALAVAAGGEFVVVWESFPQDGDNYGVFGRRFDPAGAPLGGEFTVNTYTTSRQDYPAVASDARGHFVVAWESDAQDGDTAGVFAQVFDRTGTPRGAEFRVNTYTTAAQGRPDVAVHTVGSFLVAWTGHGPNEDGEGIHAQLYDPAGVPRGGEFRVNTFTISYQGHVAAAADGAGNFVVAWSGAAQDGSGFGVFAQRLDASGAPRGSEFRVSTTTAGNQSRPDVAADAAGGFVVVWQSAGQDGSGYGVFAQLYDGAGLPRGREFQVNTYTTADQRLAAVACDGAGHFVVSWRSTQDGNGVGVFAQRFDAAGLPRGAEFRVNTYTTSDQDVPAAASDENGNFVLAWDSGTQDGSSRGIFGQRFGGLQPADLEVDTAGNGVFEPGEDVDVRPSWRNINGAAQTFGGTLLGAGGPGGATYTITDATADYGTVPSAQTGACIDCYGVMVSNPPARPVLHWDASVTERISPDAHGQQHAWRLHLGASFTDVAPSNPFYSFVETLLHHSITGGCGPSLYCPANPTTREQMSVFVLVAKEPPGFLPPACAPPNIFADVPETSAFCRWIEELANRGVVSGCGGGLYCPASPVTREQMSVFVLRTLDPGLSPPDCAPPNLFSDVPETSAFCRWIEELANRGVVSGCGGGNYCPLAPVTREQMGVFIAVTFGLTLYGV